MSRASGPGLRRDGIRDARVVRAAAGITHRRRRVRALPMSRGVHEDAGEPYFEREVLPVGRDMGEHLRRTRPAPLHPRRRRRGGSDRRSGPRALLRRDQVRELSRAASRSPASTNALTAAATSESLLDVPSERGSRASRRCAPGFSSRITGRRPGTFTDSTIYGYDRLFLPSPPRRAISRLPARRDARPGVEQR